MKKCTSNSEMSHERLQPPTDVELLTTCTIDSSREMQIKCSPTRTSFVVFPSSASTTFARSKVDRNQSDSESMTQSK